MKHEDRYLSAPPWDEARVRDELDFCRTKIDAMLPRFIDHCQSPSSYGGVYAQIDNSEWTTSFFPGMLWLMFEYTGDGKYRDAATTIMASFKDRLDRRYHTDMHDIGFLYSLSSYPAWLLCGDKEARALVVEAADILKERYFDRAGIIQAWGDISDPENLGRMIIDCNMNLPLLYRASELTGDRTYYDMAYRHIKNAQKYIVRPDDSTYHTYYMDVETGAPRFGKTAQGASDDSCWARGQAWGVYGFTLSYLHTGDVSLLDTACRLADYYLDRLPEDYVNYWDLSFIDGDEPRDSSSSVIYCCGALEFLKHLPYTHPRRRLYDNSIGIIMDSLAKRYTTRENSAEGLLLHGVYSKPHGNGVDECMSWGDYYYVEALVRMLGTWRLYW